MLPLTCFDPLCVCRDHAAEAQIEAIGATAGLFASKMVNAISGITLRMEAQRVIIAHAQAQVCAGMCVSFQAVQHLALHC